MEDLPATGDGTRTALSKGKRAWNILDKRQICSKIALETSIDSSFGCQGVRTVDVKYLEMLKGARNIATVAANIQPGEDVLIVTDNLKTSLAEVLAIACQERGAEVTISVMGLRELGQEPPKPVAKAMRSADVIFTPTLVTMYHTRARVQACQSGARVLTLSGANEETLMRQAMRVDFRRLAPGVQKVADRLARAKSIEFRAPSGTHLTANVDGRGANADTGLCHRPGQCMGMPLIEANVPPLEDTVEGRVVVDASASIIGLIEKPIKLIVKKGKIAEITGGREADELRCLLEKASHPNAYQIAEIAVGLNPKSEVVGILTEDESAWRTGHIGVGNNIGLGGVSEAPLHMDMIIQKPTILLDESFVLIKEGIPQVGHWDE